MNALDNEFVINKCDGEVFQFSDNVTIVYGDWQEAHDDCSERESVVSLSKLSAVLLSEIINQSKSD